MHKPQFFQGSFPELVETSVDFLAAVQHSHSSATGCKKGLYETTNLSHHRQYKYHTLDGKFLKLEYPNSQSLPLGVVVKRTPGVTRWAKYAWKVTSVLPGAAAADWKVLRTEGDVTEFHGATLPLTLYVSDAEAYAHELQAREPSVYVVLRQNEQTNDLPWTVALVTASPYEAQDYCDSAEELVEKIPMPEGLHNWIARFVDTHYEEEAFVKRRRDKARVDRVDDGIGDARIRQASDVYRAPRRNEVLN